jgi:hypothetical protein
MTFRTIAKLGSLRIATLALMLAQNVLVVRFLPLDEIGRYYLIATIAYLGNAVVFVGADFHLQRALSHLSENRQFSRSGLMRYIFATGTGGSILVLVASSMYAVFVLGESWLLFAAVCCALSLSTYLSGLGRNLLQLAALPTYSNLGPLTEGSARTMILILLALYGHANAALVATASAVGSLLAAAVTLTLLCRMSKPSNESYLKEPSALFKKVLPVGSSGFLNWAQLQGYRTVVASNTGGTQFVGTVSFMSTLGSTAANAAFTILAQLQVPRQYQSKGASTSRYLFVLGLLTVLLAILSLPAGAVFLWLTGRTELFGRLYLVALGVLLEAGNAAIGICTNHANALGKPMWQLPLAGLIGCSVAYGILFAPALAGDPIARIATSLALGQLAATGLVLFFTYSHSRDHLNAQQ